MATDRTVPTAQPGLATHAGLTPQMSIVDNAGRPTTFFFRWLLTIGGQGSASDDLLLLESFTMGAEALTEGAATAEAGDAQALAGDVFAAAAPPEYIHAETRFLEALMEDPAPPAITPPVIRDVLANIPAGFNAGDDGRTFEATDYRHTWRWDGPALRWRFAAGDGSGQVVIAKPDGTAPDGGLWALCDGSVVGISRDDGTITNFTTQNLTGGVFIKGDVIAAQQVATAPTWQAGAATDADGGSGQAVQSGSGVTVAAHPHAHTLTAAKLNPPSEANGGLPLRVGVAFWIRR